MMFKSLPLDVDECASDNGGCSDVCINSPGTRTCGCPGGFLLGADGATCMSEYWFIYSGFNLYMRSLIYVLSCNYSLWTKDNVKYG